MTPRSVHNGEREQDHKSRTGERLYFESGMFHQSQSKGYRSKAREAIFLPS
jgi:hypothetical protein